MFEKLLEFAASVWTSVCPVAVVNQWEDGVVVRLGREQRPLKTGVVWLIPLVDQVLKADTRQTTETTKIQSITAPDGTTWTFSIACTWYIKSSREYLLHVHDGDNVVLDSLLGAAARSIATSEGSILGRTDELSKQIKAAANRAARGWGVKFERVQFCDLSISESYRLFTPEGFSVQ